MNSKEKGKRGERELASILYHWGGWMARRTGFMQSQKGHEAADVDCPELPIHWEAKRCQVIKMIDWLAQARGDAKEDQMPVVAFRKNHMPWHVTLSLEHFIQLLSLCDLEALREQLKQQEKSKW